MTKWLLLVVCLGIACQDVTSAAHQKKSSEDLAHSMKVIYEWKHIDYDFGSEEKRQAAIQSGEYDHTKNYPFDVDRWHDKTFVTVERFNGVPSSLNVITNKKGKGGPLLQPYPDWSFAKYEDCSGIVNAFKIAVDRLWVLDSGLVNNNNLMCSPKLLTFDLNTSKLLKQVEIPHNIAVNATTGMGELVSLAVQVIDPTNTMVYIADERGEGLIIYQNSDDSFHRLTSNTFDYDPRYTKLTVAGESFTVKNGICGIALSPVTNNLYYSPLASHSLYYVNTEPFMKSQFEENNVQYEGSQDILNTQSFAKAVSRNGVLFVGLVSNSGVGCVNEHQVLQKENFDVVAQNEETLQMVVSMKIMQDRQQSRRINKSQRNEYMLALSNRMQKIINNNFNFDEVNFRILGANVNDLIRNTRCVNSNNQNANNQNANNQNANNQNANSQNANNQNGNKQSDNKQNGNMQNDNMQNGNKQNDNKQNGNRQNDNRQNGNRQNGNRQNGNRQNGNRQNDNKQNDNRQNDKRQNDNRQNDDNQNNQNGNNQNDNQVRHSSKSH
ncbi:major royal jelly protein 3-like isoform X2 [Apis florea]|uniref:major royal jelly protein 3-like isoform X2 n=1 Tax=Apis florea TaxID=7463 RepID=UPI0012FF3369|nr:major royal jelly protein 3-like isoform X2 [Apis florea]